MVYMSIQSTQLNYNVDSNTKKYKTIQNLIKSFVLQQTLKEHFELKNCELDNS